MKYIANETLMMAGRLISAGQAIELEAEHAELLSDLVSPAAEGKGKRGTKSEPAPAEETETANTTSNESQKEGDQP